MEICFHCLDTRLPKGPVSLNSESLCNDRIKWRLTIHCEMSSHYNGITFYIALEQQ